MKENYILCQYKYDNKNQKIIQNQQIIDNPLDMLYKYIQETKQCFLFFLQDNYNNILWRCIDNEFERVNTNQELFSINDVADILKQDIPSNKRDSIKQITQLLSA